MNVIFNGFASIRENLKERNIPCVNAPVTVAKGCTALGLMKQLGLQDNEVIDVFINSTAKQLDTTLSGGDRVAFIQPGIPGPHPILLGIKKI
jgi:molybdopterin converting factor small subunit